jgi:hypothetical protein
MVSVFGLVETAGGVVILGRLGSDRSKGKNRLAFVVSHPFPKSVEGGGTRFCGFGGEDKD